MLMEIQKESIRTIIVENISLSRFAKCMGISRPTLYKYMEAYDSGDVKLIPDGILKVFDTASSRIPKDRLQAYFNDIYANHIRTEERKLRENPVPSDIAEIVDGENLDVKDIDRMIEKAERHLEYLLGKDCHNEDEVERIKKDILDLGYTREMVEKRQSESRFLLIFNADWTVCTGPDESDAIICDENTKSENPDIDSYFRFYLTRAKSGYTVFFYNADDEDSVEVQLLAGTEENKITDVIGTFHPDSGMKFIKIPDLFDIDYEDLFRYRVIRSNKGKILNSALGAFTDA